MKVILTGQTPSQKNAKQIAINRRTGMRFPMTSPAVKAWQCGAILEAKLSKKPWHWSQVTLMPFVVGYSFYVKDNRRRDLDNMIASCNDVLVRSDVLPDDCWQKLRISGATAEIDAKNPRAEIDIELLVDTIKT